MSLHINNVYDRHQIIGIKDDYVPISPLSLFLVYEMYKSLIPIKKYDIRSYIEPSKLKINSSDRIKLDWCNILFGIVNLYIDSIRKIARDNVSNDINILKKIDTSWINMFLVYLRHVGKGTTNKKIKMDKDIRNSPVRDMSITVKLYKLYYMLEETYKTGLYDAFSEKNFKICKEVNKITKEKRGELFLLNNIINNRIGDKYLRNDNIYPFAQFTTMLT